MPLPFVLLKATVLLYVLSMEYMVLKKFPQKDGGEVEFTHFRSNNDCQASYIYRACISWQLAISYLSVVYLQQLPWQHDSLLYILHIILITFPITYTLVILIIIIIHTSTSLRIIIHFTTLTVTRWTMIIFQHVLH